MIESTDFLPESSGAVVSRIAQRAGMRKLRSQLATCRRLVNA